MSKDVNPVILVVLDGWGLKRSGKYNAISRAKTPVLDSLRKQNSNTVLYAHDGFVGLPKGPVIGNSEVGHMHLGAGRLIEQDLIRINDSIKSGAFFRNSVLNKAFSHSKKTKGDMHFLGLLSDGNVHSHSTHLLALLKMAKQKKVKRVFIHALLDGRDVPPKCAEKYIRRVLKEIKKLKLDAKFASIMGRFYGMDRDNRWTREFRAYTSLVTNHSDYLNKCNLSERGKHCVRKLDGEFIFFSSDPISALHEAYSRGETDEFVAPTVIEDGAIKDGDSVVFFNFRSDRAREITRAFVDGKFNKFKRPKKLRNLYFTCLTQYDKKIKAPVVFPPSIPKHTLGSVIASQGLKQLRVAETEKYPRFPFFFNGGTEKPHVGEDRIMVNSPKVGTYDKTPAMSANKLTTALLKRLKSRNYSLVVLNFANADMVGHTGMISPAVSACETVDKCLGRVVKAFVKKGGSVVITADHGNAEEMSGLHQTSHTTNKVPFIIVSENKYKLKKGKSIAYVAPTILELMGLKKPKCMNESLIVRS